MRKIQWFHPQSHNQSQLKPTYNLSLLHLILNNHMYPLLMVEMEHLIQVVVIQPPVQVEEAAAL